MCPVLLSPIHFWCGTTASGSCFSRCCRRRPDGAKIGMAKSRNGLAWQYQQSILREPFHLSYPHVFRWQGDYFMTPEALGHGAIVL